MRRQIIAMGGGALPAELDNLLLVRYFLAQTRRRKPKVAFIGAAGGDSDAGRLRFYAGFSQFECRPAHLPLFARTPRDLESFVLEQDAIFVGGGNTRSMLAVWRDWGLDRHLRTAWERGVVLGGGSAGSICWFEHGVTDSVAGPLTALPCLGFLPGSNCPHYDSEPLRRPAFRKLIASGTLPDGVAADDGVALHYIDGRLARVVSSRSRAKGYRLTRVGKRAVERALATRYLGGKG
ncbi:MAG TPA: peptidase E [Burkholderiales bacterium]|jgi:peptidase E|nr:peptidase E [Burkholderiales bacterium]